MSRKIEAKITSFLYARPSFFEGVARIIDSGNVLQEYNTSSSPESADKRAILADWVAVGEDMRQVMQDEQAKWKS